MSEDSNPPADLSNIGIDLSQIFRPAWTVESPDSTARLAARFDDEERPERRDGEGGNRRREKRGGDKFNPSRGRDPRAARPEFGGRDARTGAAGKAAQPSRGEQGRPQENRDRGRGRDPRERRQEDRRDAPPPKPSLEGWNITLIPEESALEGIAKQIRSRAKAYPLFELARLIVRLSDRYRIHLKAQSEASPALFRVKTDGSLWTSRREAAGHLLSRHFEKFYRPSSITVEAPKGSYSVVAQCGMSGVLLGPPNHHEYQSRLLSLHATRFKNLPFEVYKTRIKMVRDEALLEQWKTEQSTRIVYFPLKPGPVNIPSQEEPSAVAESTQAPEVESDVPVMETEPTVQNDEIPSEALSGRTAEEAALPEETPADEPSGKSPEEEEKGLTREEAEAHFHTHHAATAVEAAGSEITAPGRVALHGSDPLLRELLLKTLQELDRFPLPLAQIVGKKLSSSGLQIFKAQKKIIHVSVARPRYLDRATTPISENFRKILDYLEAHPNQHRDKQWAGLLAQITEPAGDEPEAVQRREQVLGTDLLWLLHQGHVLDFAMGNLQAAHIPVSKPTSAPEEQEKPKGVALGETLGAETSSEAEAVATGEISEPTEPTVAVEVLEESAEEIFPEMLSEATLIVSETPAATV